VNESPSEKNLKQTSFELAVVWEDDLANAGNVQAMELPTYRVKSNIKTK